MCQEDCEANITRLHSATARVMHVASSTPCGAGVKHIFVSVSFCRLNNFVLQAPSGANKRIKEVIMQMSKPDTKRNAKRWTRGHGAARKSQFISGLVKPSRE